MNKRRINIRIDDRMAMLLDELSGITGASVSLLVRGMLLRIIDELIDKSGKWKIANEKNKERVVNHDVINTIARNYYKLKELCRYDHDLLLCSKSYEDLFQDAVLYVSQDEKAVSMPSGELIDYFRYKFNMIKYQALKDNAQLKEIPYADYIQASQKDISED